MLVVLVILPVAPQARRGGRRLVLGAGQADRAGGHQAGHRLARHERHGGRVVGVGARAQHGAGCRPVVQVGRAVRGRGVQVDQALVDAISRLISILSPTPDP